MSGYFPPPSPGGGGGIALPVGTAGLQDGLIGMEYNGDPVAIAARFLLYDTLYVDPLTGASTTPDWNSGPVVTDEYSFDGSEITPAADGFYAVVFYAELDAPLTAPCTATLVGAFGHPTTYYTGPDTEPANRVQFSVAVPVRAGAVVAWYLGADAADAGVNMTYSQFGIAKLA